MLLSYSQAGPNRKAKQGQEEISRNYVPTFFLGSIHSCLFMKIELKVKNGVDSLNIVSNYVLTLNDFVALLLKLCLLVRSDIQRNSCFCPSYIDFNFNCVLPVSSASPSSPPKRSPSVPS